MMRAFRSGTLIVALFFLACSSTRYAAGQDAALDATLEKAGQLVVKFLDQLSDVKCTEQVLQQKFNKDGHVELSDNSRYDYLVMLQGDKDDFLMNESRIEEKPGQEHKKNLPLLLTNGFSSLYLIFHPYYRNSFQFVVDGVEIQNYKPLLRVRFSHIPGTRTPAALAIRGREYPLDLNGTAWISPQTGAIVRIETGLQTDMKDVGLRSLTAVVEYAPAHLVGVADTFLFPTSATIDVQTLRQHWRNTHHFEGYLRFSVEAEQTQTAKVKP